MELCEEEKKNTPIWTVNSTISHVHYFFHFKTEAAQRRMNENIF